ncbi:unnamed protein product [Mytilus coruscus]|uniref:Uncharacterized protein n=1 Tax=Mytilus coruscus TaxID=42192 RepID=A0A6J8ALS8_MYTCO|nr:unnamed protein product [Mytilus coruscus]
MDKQKAATDYAELDYPLRIEKAKFETIKSRMDKKMEEIDHINKNQQNDQHFANGYYNKEGKSNKPTALLIGTSNTNRIDENKPFTAVDITKAKAYALDAAHQVISTSQCNPDVIIIHSLTYDVKNKNPNECMEKLQMVVESISSKWKEAETKVSLTTPFPPSLHFRLDNRLHCLNSEIIDGLVKR